MVIGLIILGAFCAAISYVAWTYFHEISHVIAASKTAGITKYSINVFPTFSPRLLFGYCDYDLKRKLTAREQVIVSLAPRIPDAVAVLAFPVVGYLGNVVDPAFAIMYGVFWGAGIVDLMVGSMGMSPHSDLRKAATDGNINPWKLRLAGWGAVLLSVGAAAALFFGG